MDKAGNAKAMLGIELMRFEAHGKVKKSKEELPMDYGKIAEIRDKLGEEEILTQLAEEAAELAQAALKLRRAISGKNPTPKGVGECREALSEELTDVHLCALIVQADPSLQLMSEKVERWHKRLSGTENVVLTRGMEESNG